MDDLFHALIFIAVFGCVFLLLILFEFLYLKHKGVASYYLKETLANMATGGLYKLVDGIAIALFIQAFYESVQSFGFGFQPELSVVSVILLFVAQDFFYYWYHVAMHKVRWAWAVHVTHHSSKHLNLSTALRQNFLLDINFVWVLWWIPLALIGFDKDWALIAIEASLVYQFFLHTQVIGRLGVLEYVFNTPSHHRVHHGCKEDQVDTNFGGVLIIWDRLFGTFVDESKVSAIEYGVAMRQPTTFNPLRLNLDEFCAMFKDVVRYRDLSIFVRPPSYVEDRYGAQEQTKKAA